MRDLETLIELEEGEEVHVIPRFGREHVCSRSCWCNPAEDSEEPSVIVHNVFH